MTNEQTSTAQDNQWSDAQEEAWARHNVENEQLATLDYLAGKLQHAYHERQRRRWGSGRISRLDVLEVIHAILRYEVDHGL